MAEAQTTTAPSAPATGNWVLPVALAWLVPGGGHFLLRRPGRGAIILGAVAGMFLFGLGMRGAMFAPQTGDLLTTIIYVGGWIADFMSGIFYLLATMFGYSQPDVAGHVHDYGAKFLVGAGLLNILGMVDAFEIATGKKS